ncbi:MAG: hypothetical protein PUF51_03115 [Bifidobacteriaceae bacterium]|nr:hypothetical protein [Bifidobacteriaceae bacterium]
MAGTAPNDHAAHGNAKPDATPQGPLRRTPLSRLVDAASRARTSTRSFGKATLSSVARLVALLSVIVFVALRVSGMSTEMAGGCVCIFVGITLGWTLMTVIMNAADTGHPKPAVSSLIMMAASIIVMGAGVILVCASLMPWAYVLRGLLGGVLLIAGLVFIIAPWWLSLVSDLGAEKARAAREELRADYATQLHDSVLQTLALIQMDADDPVKTRALARAQERDLREWLYGDPGAVLSGPGRGTLGDFASEASPVDVAAVADSGAAPGSRVPADPMAAGVETSGSEASGAGTSEGGGTTPASATEGIARSGAVTSSTTPGRAMPSVTMSVAAMPGMLSPYSMPATLSRAVKLAAAQVEDSMEVPIGVVVVGDCAMTPALAGMVAAAMEAMRNATRHGAPPISVYAEVSAEGLAPESSNMVMLGANESGAPMSNAEVEIFVRDHGEGFDISHLPAGHRGVKDSILGRMERLGGTASIDSRPGWGTEVHLTCRAGHQ